MALLSTANAFTVKHDRGGTLNKYIHLAATLKHVRIDGYCASACGLLLNVKSKCATPRAVLGFHAAKMNGKPFPGFDKVFLGLYPADIRIWLRRNGALKRHRITYLRPPALYKYIPKCK